MQTAPRGACQIEAFNRAMSEMKLAMSRAGGAWYRAANIDPNNPRRGWRAPCVSTRSSTPCECARAR